jgi:hypothetical protein
MGTFDNLYLNRIKQLQEENNNLRAILNEARIRQGPLHGAASGDPPGAESPFTHRARKEQPHLLGYFQRDWERAQMTRDALTGIADPNNPINDPANKDELAAIRRVLSDMGAINLDMQHTADWVEPGPGPRIGLPAAKGGPGTGSANVEDMKTFIRATRRPRSRVGGKLEASPPGKLFRANLTDQNETGLDEDEFIKALAAREHEAAKRAKGPRYGFEGYGHM